MSGCTGKSPKRSVQLKVGHIRALERRKVGTPLIADVLEYEALSDTARHITTQHVTPWWVMGGAVVVMVVLVLSALHMFFSLLIVIRHMELFVPVAII